MTGLRPSRPEVEPVLADGLVCAREVVNRGGGRLRLALPLLVAEVLADDHHPTVATNDLAFVADRLDARLDLHGRVSFAV